MVEFKTRERNTCIITLTEGDVLINGDDLKHVSEGEVSIYADGTIDTTKGELAEISVDGIPQAIAAGKTLFNMEDIA